MCRHTGTVTHDAIGIFFHGIAGRSRATKTEEKSLFDDVVTKCQRGKAKRGSVSLDVCLDFGEAVSELASERDERMRIVASSRIRN